MSDEPEKIDFRNNLRIYLDFLKKYRVTFIILVMGIFILEASEIADKYLLKIVIDNASEFAAGTLVRSAFVQVLMAVVAAFIIIALLRILFRWIHMHLLNRLDANLVYDLKTQFFSHILLLSYNFHTTHKTGTLISRLTRGSRAIERMTDIFVFFLFPLIFQLVLVFFSIVYFDVSAAIIIILIVVAFAAYSYYIQELQESSSIKANDSEDIEKGAISDIFSNIESVKYFGKEEYIKKKYESISANTRRITIFNWDFYRWIDGGQALILAIGTFLIIYFPLTRFLDGEISLGTLVFIYTVFGNILDPLYRFVQGMREYYSVMADFQSLFEYNKLAPEVKDMPFSTELVITQGTIEFRNMSFKYGNRQMFDNFNLKIPKNKKIALVGHSGSGKSTLIRLLYRLYDVNSGQITIDGRDIREFKQQSLRSEMSIVPQEAVLFDDTIYNNVAFSRPDASREEVMAAIRFAQLDKIINELPQKENTIVGERGVKLSGGERQRVSIARALLANKKILVLDEATSSLDSETEQQIQQALARLMRGRTSIIIAHRLSTIMKSDRIIVMKKGQIVESGTHQELIRHDGEYRRLWNLQKGGYIR